MTLRCGANAGRAEYALRLSEVHYRALYEDNPSMYFSINAEGKVLSVNHYGAQQLRYGVDELVGLPVLIVFHRDDREAVEQQFMMCLQNPMHIAHWEFCKIRKDGSILWVKEAARAVIGPDGNLIIIVVCEDITERKVAEEALKKRKEDLIGMSHKFEELNATMKVLLEQREQSKKELEEWVVANVENNLMPYIEKIKKIGLESEALAYINLLEKNLKNVTSSFSRNLSSKYINLTSKEIQIANLVKDGKNS